MPAEQSPPGQYRASLGARCATTYDAVAATYENRFLEELRDKPRDRELLEGFAANIRDPVVDVASGPWQTGAFVRRHGRVVFGLSREMTALAKRRLDAALADMRALSLADGTVVITPRGSAQSRAATSCA